MKLFSLPTVICALLLALSTVSNAADFPTPKEGSWVVKDFRFHTGQVLPELRLNYTTVGDPKGEPVLVLHGTTGSGMVMLNPGFAGELFGVGQPLDASKYFIILRAAFPKYNYDDMVDAQYRLVTEHLGIKHLRLDIGNSMGGMQTWIWGTKHPHSWTHWCPWPHRLPKCPAATGSGAV